MKIFVNDLELDSKLEKEENLGQIYLEVQKWAESQGKFLLQCLKDGEEILKTELDSIPIGSAQRLDFYIGENMDILVATLLELDRYIDVVGNTLLGRDSLTEKENNDLREGVHWIDEVLISAGKLLKLDFSKTRPIPNGKNVSEILFTTSTMVTKLGSYSEIEFYLENLRDLKLFVMNLINKSAALTVDTSTLKEVIHAYSENMEVLKKEFIRVNENFQSGKDAIASELLIHSAGRLQVLLSSIVSLQSKLPEKNFQNLKMGNSDLNSTIESLKKLLEQIAISLEDKDIVMAGDLLEYELPELLDNLVPFLKEIKKIS